MKTKFVSAISVSLIFIPIITVAQSPQPIMKAAVVHEYGGPEVFKYEDVARPEPQDSEILIHVMAAGVNPVDAYVRQGRFANRGPRPASTDHWL